MVLPYSNADYGEDQVGATNIQELTDVELTNLANGEVLKYNLTSDKWENFAPTYLDGTGISDNFLIKIVSGAATQTSFIETSVLNTSTSLKTYIPLTPPLSLLAGSIETELFDSTKKRMHLTTSGIATSNGITITSDGRVGIGVVNPEEDFEIDGNIQLDTGGAQRGRVIFYDKQNDHEHAEVDGLGEGTNGGALVFYTKVDGGSVTEKIRINNVGAIGIAGANFGTTNQVLISNGSNSAVEWTDSVTFTDATVTGTVVTPEVASTTSTIDLGSGVNRRIRIEDKSTTNFGEIEIKPIRTAAGISSNVEPINSYIQCFAQNGASDMTLFSEDLIQIRTNNNSYIRVTPTEATCTSPFYNPNTIITSSDSPWLTSPIPYTSNLNGLTLRHSSLTSNTAYWNLACSFNGVTQTGNLHFTYGGVRKGYLAETTYVGAIDFTGQHRSQFEGEFTQELVGLIVESTGAYLELDGSVAPTIDEALPSVRLTSSAKSKRVYGVLSGIEGETREYGTGFVTVLPKDDGVTRVIVNSVGEGSLWVINTNGNLENGDYVCSSSIMGYGERQEDDLLHSYTVAKVTMDLDWSNLPDWVQTRRVNVDGTIAVDGTHLCAFVGCTYHCG